MSTEFEKHFKKVFEFQRTPEWRLPETVYSAPRFEIPEFQDMKNILNHVKSQPARLKDFDLSRWHDHTENQNIAGYVNKKLQAYVQPELRTKAFSKFYEIFATFPLVPPHSNIDFNSLHLCEAPGASICALNHWLVLNYPNIHWEWEANTLNPYYEGNSTFCMIDDDRLIRFTKNRWLFGVDMTGDILQYYNHADIIAKGKKYELITADGSIDCSGNPGEQESLVEFLQYCETMTALKVLDFNGTFILKIFTIFEESTICLAYLLNCLFTKTYLFKPCTSKPGNSELYFVCLGFNNNLPSSVWNSLITPYKNGCFDKYISMFSGDDIPASFLSQLKDCCVDFFIERQIDAINDNINNYTENAYSSAYSYKLKAIKDTFAYHFIDNFKIEPIPRHYKICPYINIHVRQDLLNSKFDNSKKIQKVSLQNLDLCEYVKIYFCKRIEVVSNSKFTSRFEENQIKLLNNTNKNSTPLYNLVLNFLTATTTVINVKSFSLSSQYKFQKDLFDLLNNQINEEKHIIFLNIPFFTHFMASLWSILGMAFEIVYFGKGWCFFYKPFPEKVKLVKNVFAKVASAYHNINTSNIAFSSDIYSILPPNMFLENLKFVREILNICNNFTVGT